ncbi:hypothetical protein HY634_01455 [Candidatus Uhrbacteria bacterium]|nr:hypothetical protein [Candidatus Uhrbacteria bacterium]
MRIARRRIALFMGIAVGCAHPRTPHAPTSADAAQRAHAPQDVIAGANTEAGGHGGRFVAFIERRPPHCDGALCWAIENGHRNPVLLTINGEPVEIVGTSTSYLLPGSSAYIRVAEPGRYRVTYTVHDTARANVSAPLVVLPTVLHRCHLEADVGSTADAHWGGHVTHLDHTFCY